MKILIRIITTFFGRNHRATYSYGRAELSARGHSTPHILVSLHIRNELPVSLEVDTSGFKASYIHP